MIDPARARFRRWVALVIWLLIGLSLFVWAGTAPHPRRMALWVFTKDGWIVPAQSLTWIWIFGALLLAILSCIADLLFHPMDRARTLKPWASAGIILAMAAATRIVVACTWLPWALPHPPAGVHALLIAADLIIVGLLLLALHGAGQSLWWAALYAFHPLPLVEVAANAHWVVAPTLALVFVAAIAHRLPRVIHLAVAGAVALAAVAWIAWANRSTTFNSLLADMGGYLNTPGVLLPVSAAILETAVLLLAMRAKWSLAKMLGHVMVVALICSPNVPAWTVVPLLALLSLAWTNAGWVLSITVLAASAAVITPKLPTWLLMLEWMPVIVVEAQELLVEMLALPRRAKSPSVPAAAQVP